VLHERSGQSYDALSSFLCLVSLSLLAFLALELIELTLMLMSPRMTPDPLPNQAKLALPILSLSLMVG
jgi:hypothetical protein